MTTEQIRIATRLEKDIERMANIASTCSPHNIIMRDTIETIKEDFNRLITEFNK